MSTRNDGGNHYVHLCTRNDHRGIGLCGTEWARGSQLVLPLAVNLSKVTCPICKVLWDQWVETTGMKKSVTNRRWTAFKKQLAASGLRLEPPDPPVDRPVIAYVYVDRGGTFSPANHGRVMEDSNGKDVYITVPANTPIEEVNRRRHVRWAEVLSDNLLHEQQQKLAARDHKLELKLALVARLEKKLESTERRLQKARRSLSAMERARAKSETKREAPFDVEDNHMDGPEEAAP